MNSVNLIGRVTQDVELKATESGKSVMSFTLAVDRGYGENKTADFITCVVWNEYAEKMSKLLTKGKQIGVTGNLKSRTYEDKNETTHYVTEVYVDNITFVGKKEQSNDD